jgi:hypothetical protein
VAGAFMAFGLNPHPACSNGGNSKSVMPGLVPGIHAFTYLP